jgi:Tol biopolymer transport system component
MKGSRKHLRWLAILPIGLLIVWLLIGVFVGKPPLKIIDGQVAYHTVNSRSCIAKAMFDQCFQLGHFLGLSPLDNPIAYTEKDDLYRAVYRNGKEDPLLTEVAWPAYPEVWSPDSTRIAYLKEITSHDRRLCVVNADGTDNVCLETGIDLSYPSSWSPDGRQIAFDGQNANESLSSIYLINIDGTNLRLLAQDGQSPDWSPNGSQIAFSSSHTGSSIDIYVVNVDGSNLTRLTDGLASNFHPVWSPGGTKIAFLSTRGNQTMAIDLFDTIYKADIYVMNRDGSNVRLLLSKPGDSIEYFVWH